MNKTVSLLAILCLILSFAAPVSAEGAESATSSLSPAEWCLPWASGVSAIVTWQPEDHWANAKASGLAFDFSLPEGTPLFAPAAGQAMFQKDTRALETTLGNYIDLAIGDDWIIRMAHLRDEQLGSAYVERGQFLGFVGHSGVDLTHLHLEVLRIADGRQYCPTRDDLPLLMGLSLTELATDAVVTNLETGIGLFCQDLYCPETALPLGEAVISELHIRNATLVEIRISSIKTTLVSPEGESHTSSLHCDTRIPVDGSVAVPLTLLPHESGYWTVAGISTETSMGIIDIPVSGGFMAGPALVELVGISGLTTCSLGQTLTAQVWLCNRTEENLSLEHIELCGVSPDGETWVVQSDKDINLQPGEIAPTTVTVQPVTRSAGDWTIERVAFVNEGNTFTLAHIEQNLHVSGPQVRIQQVSVCPSPEGNKVFLLVQNDGDAQVAPSRLHLWALDAEGASYFPVSSEPVGPIDPGQQRLVEAEIWEGEEGLTLVQAGYWAEGAFWPIGLPASLTRNTHWNADATL